MTKKTTRIISFVAILQGALLMAGCETVAEVLFSSVANTNSSSTEQGLIYYFYNESSHSVTIIDPTGSLVINPGGNAQIRYNREVSINNVDYALTDLVYPRQSSGTHITFYDR